MANSLYFWIPLLVLLLAIWRCDVRYNLLRDNSDQTRKPYSYSRVQIAWWTAIIFSSIIAIMLCKNWVLADINEQTLYLLGISATTTLTARTIDVMDATNPDIPRASLIQNTPGKTLIYDILTDKGGIGINRFQAVLFNLILGVWYVHGVLVNLGTIQDANKILPVISPGALWLMGISSTVYAGLKVTENKQPDPVKVAGQGA